MLTDKGIDALEETFYNLEDNYDLAEWARMHVPDLLKSIREEREQIRGALIVYDNMAFSPERDRMVFNILRGTK